MRKKTELGTHNHCSNNLTIVLYFLFALSTYRQFRYDSQEGQNFFFFLIVTKTKNTKSCQLILFNVYYHLRCILRGSPLLSILEAVFTVSPKRQYLQQRGYKSQQSSILEAVFTVSPKRQCLQQRSYKSQPLLSILEAVFTVSPKRTFTPQFVGAQPMNSPIKSNDDILPWFLCFCAIILLYERFEPINY